MQLPGRIRKLVSTQKTNSCDEWNQKQGEVSEENGQITERETYFKKKYMEY